MKNKIRVAVTQDDIDRGRPGMAAECPIARALQRRLDLQDERVTVSNRVASLGGAWWLLSRPAQKFVEEFDRGGDVNPCVLSLRRE